jgi:hypothetical protein
MARIFNEGFEFGNKGQFYRATAEASYGTNAGTRLPGGRIANFGKGGSLTARLAGLSEFYTRFLYFCNTWDAGHYYGRRLVLGDSYGKAAAQVFWGYQDQPNPQYGIGFYVGTQTQPVASRPALLTDHEYRAVVEIHYRYTLSSSTAASPNFEMRVNGATVLTYTGPTALQPSPLPAEPVEYKIREISYCAPPNRWGALDDVAINDTSGSVDNAWCGDGVIALLKPNANVTSQLTRSDATKQNYQLVSDLNAGTWVESDVAGRYDSYGLAVPTLKPSDTVTRVWVQANARRLSTDAPGISVGLDRGSSMEWSAALELGLDPTGVQGQQYLSNGGAAWTQAALSTLKVGVKIE